MGKERSYIKIQHYMKGFSKMERDKDMERCIIALAMNIKVNGEMIKKMEKGQWTGLILIKDIQDNGLMINHQELEITIGLIVK